MAIERAPRDRYAHVDTILRFVVATSFLFAYCTVVLSVYAAADAGRVVSLAPGAEESRAQARSLGTMISITLGVLSLLPHFATLAIGYRRWKAMSIARWAIGSTVAGTLCPLIWRMTSGFVAERYARGNNTLLLALISVAIVLVTLLLFELMLRTGGRRSA